MTALAYRRRRDTWTAIGIIVVLARQLGRDLDSAHAVALGLIIGGAAGNLIDRLVRDEGLLRGAVVDFIDLQWFPVFNVADAAINIGAVLLILAVLRESRRTDGGAAE